MIDRLWLNAWMGHSKWSLLKESNTWCSNVVHFHSSKQYNILLSLKNRWRHWGILNQSFSRSQLSSRSVQSQTACLPLLSWRNSILRLAKLDKLGIKNIGQHWSVNLKVICPLLEVYLSGNFQIERRWKVLGLCRPFLIPYSHPLWRHGMSTA